MSSNLIIIGNGFDLKCGVKSTFKDFFDNRISNDVKHQIKMFLKDLNLSFNYSSLSFNHYDEYEGVFIDERHFNKIKDANLTFWDLLFIVNKNLRLMKNWYNVEQNMLDILKGINLIENYSDLGRPLIDGFPGLREGMRSSKEIDLIKCSILAYYSIPKNRYRSKRDLNDFLLSELFEFESAFTRYLENEISKTTDYSLLSEKIISKIIGEDNSIDDTATLSFNYTEPRCLINKITNVHGKLKKNNIIFGIDQDEIPTTSLLYRYTKTFRKMIQKKEISEDYVYINNKNDLKNIFFYGHGSVNNFV